MIFKTLQFPSIPAVAFSLSHVDPATASALNHNESHIHSACEIYINLSGDVVFEVENHIYPISRGSVIITRPYEYHHCILRSCQPHEHYWITFSAQESDGFWELFFHREKGRDNLILLDADQLRELCAVLDGLLQEHDDLLTQQIGFLRIFQLLRSGKGASGETAVQLPADVAQALRFMDERLSEELDVQTVADACHVSVTTLERHFKEALHATPFAVLRKKRLFCSMEQLRNGASVAEAARESGFSDYSHYIQLFRRQFGVTPLCYKKKFRSH